MSDKPDIGSQGTAAFRKVQQEARIRSSHVGIPSYSGTSAPRSGVQPDVRGMVLCPFCAKPFPYSVALLNRQLRCNGCRSVFRVAEDRRSFRILPASGKVAPESGSLSKATRSAIQEANASLNEAAAEALRVVSRQERGAPPGSGSAIRARPAAAPPPKPTIPRKRSEAILTGEGVARGRRLRHLIVAASILAAMVCGLGLWLFRSDPQRDALWSFQGRASAAQNWSAAVAALRQAAIGTEVAPIVGIDRAIFGEVMTIDMEQIRKTLGQLRTVGRQGVWVEQGRLGEAKALIGKHDLSTQAGANAFVTACRKAGITARAWQDAIAEAGAGAPVGTNDVLSLLLARPAPRSEDTDPAMFFGEGRFPTSIDILPFSGTDGSLLQPSGPAKSPVAYQGRLIRFSGEGWPEGWLVLDLRMIATR
jgi:hypothetical protein